MNRNKTQFINVLLLIYLIKYFYKCFESIINN